MKKQHEAEKDNTERCMLSYLDFITLLMVFFVILYSMSSVSVAKFNQMSQSFSVAFGGAEKSVIDFSNTGILPDFSRTGDTWKKQHKQYVSAVSQLQKEIESKSLRVFEDERGIVIGLASDFYFGSGSAEISSQALESLKKVYTILSESDGNIRFEGHTDNIPIYPGSALAQRYPTNWELSSQRSVNVLKYFESRGLDRKRLSAAGFADTRPLKPNDTDEGRTFNRRVDIVIVPQNGK